MDKGPSRSADHGMHNALHGNALLRVALRLVACVMPFSCFAVHADSNDDFAEYTHEGRLMKPSDYRSWVTVGAGLNMAYGPARKAAMGRPVFTNVFVSPSAYRGFIESGTWPNG